MKNKKKEFTINDIPDEVLKVWVTSYSGSLIFDELNKAIEKYPEYFPDEVEYRDKWDKVPQELKDKYHNQYSMFRLTMTDEEEKEREELFGKCPHPDIQGCGIIQRITTHEHRGADFAENDAWNDKWYKHQHKRDIDLYNELFKPYGLSKTYND